MVFLTIFTLPSMVFPGCSTIFYYLLFSKGDDKSASELSKTPKDSWLTTSNILYFFSSSGIYIIISFGIASAFMSLSSSDDSSSKESFLLGLSKSSLSASLISFSLISIVFLGVLILTIGSTSFFLLMIFDVVSSFSWVLVFFS